jgi:hypothetical protein
MHTWQYWLIAAICIYWVLMYATYAYVRFSHGYDHGHRGETPRGWGEFFLGSLAAIAAGLLLGAIVVIPAFWILIVPFFLSFVFINADGLGLRIWAYIVMATAIYGISAALLSH